MYPCQRPGRPEVRSGVPQDWWCRSSTYRAVIPEYHDLLRHCQPALRPRVAVFFPPQNIDDLPLNPADGEVPHAWTLGHAGGHLCRPAKRVTKYRILSIL